LTSNFRDYFMLFHINAAGMAGMTFCFLHPDAANFVTWCGLVGTLTTVYKWFVFKDSKTPDAPGG